MKAVVIEFHQETNSFNPVVSTIDYFERGHMYKGKEILINLLDKPCALAGMFEALEESHVQAIPGYSMFTMSGGPIDQAVVDHFVTESIQIIEANYPVDAVFISLHGATQTTTYDDCSGFIIDSIRKVVGNNVVIAASADLHANITDQMIKDTDIICGYQTYPHLDHFETGYRTAKLGLSCLLDENKPKMVKVHIPMIVPASTYTTNSDPFSTLIDHGKELTETGKVLDFSVYQMQPWLDVTEGGSSVIVIDDAEENAKQYAIELAQKLFDMRKEFKPNLYSIDEVIDFTEQRKYEKYVVLVDSADSTNAGATGDSVAVIQRLLHKQSDLKTACVVTDAPAAVRAHEIGVGKTATFSIGGTKYPEMNQPIQVECYIKSLHDGKFIQEGPAGRGMINNIGPSAVLQVGNINILVCHHIFGNGDPQLFRAFGMEPSLQELLVVKACTSFRAAYSLLTDRIFETETPGAASVDLKSLPFKRLPKDFYPFSDLDHYQVREVTLARD